MVGGVSFSNLKHSEDLGVQKGTGEGFLEEVASEMTFKGCDGEQARLVEGTVRRKARKRDGGSGPGPEAPT